MQIFAVIPEFQMVLVLDQPAPVQASDLIGGIFDLCIVFLHCKLCVMVFRKTQKQFFHIASVHRLHIAMHLIVPHSVFFCIEHRQRCFSHNRRHIPVPHIGCITHKSHAGCKCQQNCHKSQDQFFHVFSPGQSVLSRLLVSCPQPAEAAKKCSPCSSQSLF